MTPPPHQRHGQPGHSPAKTILITCGPTHEPIDAVRYIGNRSSGRMGLAIAEVAAAKGWSVRVLAGPGVPTPHGDTPIAVRQFRSTAELEALLAQELPCCDVLVMAAAVADYRPKPIVGLDPATGKLKRSGGAMTIELEPTPDLLAGCSRNRRPGQVLIGFALEPRERLMESAREKLRRKGVDGIVANPLATMDSPTIEGVLVTPDGPVTPDVGRGGALRKEAFAAWLMDRIESMHVRAASEARGPRPECPPQGASSHPHSG